MEISLLHMYMQKNTNKEDSFYVCVSLVFPFGKSHPPSGFAKRTPGEHLRYYPGVPLVINHLYCLGLPLGI